MRILLALNAFKESLSAPDACAALKEGFVAALGDKDKAEVLSFPIADGGDGTFEVLTTGKKVEIETVATTDPLGRPCKARIGWRKGGKVAVIEMAEASGIRLLKPEERNPMKTSTVGTGKLIRRAIEQGAEEIWIGLGGSATVDGGIGMASELGWKFLDRPGRVLEPNGGALTKIWHIDDTEYQAFKKKHGMPQIKVLCDVINPLLGPEGAAPIFAPQKGATPAMTGALAEGLERLADLIKEHQKKVKVHKLKHGGSAGGLAAGLHAFLGGELIAGAEFVNRKSGLQKTIEKGDWIITGEGKIDSQSLAGKGPVAIATIAREKGAKVIGVAGIVADSDQLYESGLFDAVFSLCDRPMPPVAALCEAHRLMAQLGRALGGFIAAADAQKSSTKPKKKKLKPKTAPEDVAVVGEAEDDIPATPPAAASSRETAGQEDSRQADETVARTSAPDSRSASSSSSSAKTTSTGGASSAKKKTTSKKSTVGKSSSAASSATKTSKKKTTKKKSSSASSASGTESTGSASMNTTRRKTTKKKQSGVSGAASGATSSTSSATTKKKAARKKSSSGTGTAGTKKKTAKKTKSSARKTVTKSSTKKASRKTASKSASEKKATKTEASRKPADSEPTTQKAVTKKVATKNFTARAGLSRSLTAIDLKSEEE